MDKKDPMLDSKHSFEDEAQVEEFVQSDPVYDEQETKAILRKVDWRLLPMLTLLYVLSFIDRSNSTRPPLARQFVQESANY